MYVSYEYFTDNYKSSCEIDDEFEMLEARAADIVDQATGYKIKMSGIDSFSDFDKEQIKKAVCAQIEHLFYQGVETAISGGSDGSYNIGNTSITRAIGNGSGASGASVRMSPLAKSLLYPTGLLYRGIEAVSC